MVLRLFIGLLIVSVAAPLAAHADESDKSKQSANLLRDASDARDAKDFKGCVAKSEAAWALFEHAQIRGVQGLCELELHQYREAATHLAFYVDHAASSAEPVMKDGLARAKERVAEVTLRCEPSAARLTVDGATVGKPPLTLFVDPGTHTLSARMDGYLAHDEQQELAAGTKVEVAINLSLDVVEKPRPIWPGALGLGLAGGALVAGIATTVVATGASSDAKAFEKTVGSSCSSKAPTPACQSGFDSKHKAHVFGDAAVGSFIAAGVLAAASIPYLVWAAGGRRHSESTTGWTIVPIVSPTTPGAFVNATF